VLGTECRVLWAEVKEADREIGNMYQVTGNSKAGGWPWNHSPCSNV